MSVCYVADCDRPTHARGLCNRHHQRLMTRGRANILTPGRWEKPVWKTAPWLPFLSGAACVGRDDIEWVPTMETVTRAEWDRNLARARAVCASCPVRDACLAHALVAREAGIWGGTVDEQRDRMSRPA